jgi:anti-sigma factor ChrR (cupin superfamily)
MITRLISATSLMLILAGGALAQCAGVSRARAVSHASSPVFLPPGDVKWTDLDPVRAPGIRIADLWGDHTKGAYGAFLKFPAGFLAPLHTHTYDIRAVILSGTYVQTPDGKAQERLGPGSYMLQPGGAYRHVSGCDAASDCVLFIESEGPFDLLVVEAPKPK